MRRLIVLTACLCWPALARASAADAFGLGSEESSVCGASAARVHDFSAGYYNPAGLVGATRPEASLGVLGFGSQLRIRNGGFERTAPISDPVGIVLGAATPIPFGGALADRVYVGIALYIVPGSIVHVISHAPDQPFFPLYDNRTQRLIVLPSLAARLARGWSIGLGFNYLAGLGGRVSAAEGATRAIEARVDESIFSHLAVNAGVRWQESARLALALVYRQEFGVPFRTVSRNTVAGQPIDLDVDAEELFTPHELVLGGALALPKRLLASLDLQWSHWSGWRGPYVTVTSQLPLVGGLDARPPSVGFNDTFSLRAGLEWTALERARLALKLRGGYGFETQAAPASQPGVTNLLDGPKHRLALGGGVRVRVLDGALRVDAHGQLDILQPTTLRKTVAPAGSHPDPSAALSDEVPDDPARPETQGTQISNPGYPSVSGSGFVWALGLTVTVER
ncbi:MAG TPA: hypothetical protein VFF06_26880 [Polyangia bacterium]|nr:hypothetical protein [Polyangia bacterium]